VKLTPTTGLKSIDKMSRACVVVGRMLILFSAVLAIIMPWTENFWHFDKFPYGGDDFELSVFLIVAILGLVLVLIQHGKKSVTFVLALARWLSPVSWSAISLAVENFDAPMAALRTPPLPSPILSACNLPIQV
jgi:hypothetical protein